MPEKKGENFGSSSYVIDSEHTMNITISAVKNKAKMKRSSIVSLAGASILSEDTVIGSKSEPDMLQTL